MENHKSKTKEKKNPDFLVSKTLKSIEKQKSYIRFCDAWFYPIFLMEIEKKCNRRFCTILAGDFNSIKLAMLEDSPYTRLMGPNYGRKIK